MRYYDLDINGKVKGSYAVPQPDKTLTLLASAPNDESMWNGTAWIPDPDIVNARLAEEARIAAKEQALIDNLPSWSQVDTAITNIANLADAKVFIKKLARVVYWLAKDKAD
jgi:hypothetical protein